MGPTAYGARSEAGLQNLKWLRFPLRQIKTGKIRLISGTMQRLENHSSSPAGLPLPPHFLFAAGGAPIGLRLGTAGLVMDKSLEGRQSQVVQSLGAR